MVIKARIVVLDRESDRQMLYDLGIMGGTNFRHGPSLPPKQNLQDTETQREYKEDNPDDFNK